MKCISIKHKMGMNNQETRKNFYRSMLGDYFGGKLGIIDKFNNACGFKPVVLDFSKPANVKSPEIETPDEYVAPNQLIFTNMWPDFDDGLVKIVINKGIEHHPDSRFTYGHYQVLEKFIKFIEKVYKDFDITVSEIEDFNISEAKEIERMVYSNLACMDSANVSVECSAASILAKDEIEKIYAHCDDLVPFKWHIAQYYCKTCERHSNNTPYHTEVVFE